MQNQEQMTSTPDVFTVVTWNVLLDKTRTSQGLIKPQYERLGSQVQTLRDLGVNLDVVAIQEAHVDENGHNGEILARQLGARAGFWREHNTSKRGGEYIGMFGDQVEVSDFFDLSHDKLAVRTRVGEVAVVGCHLRNETFGTMRAEQMEKLLEEIDDEEHAVVMGDFNAVPFETPMHLLREAGFQSVFTLAHKRLGGTWPTADYRRVFYPKALNRVVPSVRYDDIYVRGVEVADTPYSFVGDSDHKGLVASLAKPRS